MLPMKNSQSRKAKSNFFLDPRKILKRAEEVAKEVGGAATRIGKKALQRAEREVKTAIETTPIGGRSRQRRNFVSDRESRLPRSAMPFVAPRLGADGKGRRMAGEVFSLPKLAGPLGRVEIPVGCTRGTLLKNLPINPVTINAALSSLLQNFEKYSMDEFRVTYTPWCTDKTTGIEGSLVGYLNPDPTEDPALSSFGDERVSAAKFQFKSRSTHPLQPCSWVLPILGPDRYTTMQTTDIRDACYGRLVLMAGSDFLGHSSTLQAGELTYEMSLRLKIPHIQQSGMAGHGAKLQSSTGIDATHFLGTVYSTEDWSDVGVIFDGGLQFTLPARSCLLT